MKSCLLLVMFCSLAASRTVRRSVKEEYGRGRWTDSVETIEATNRGEMLTRVNLAHLNERAESSSESTGGCGNKNHGGSGGCNKSKPCQESSSSESSDCGSDSGSDCNEESDCGKKVDPPAPPPAPAPAPAPAPEPAPAPSNEDSDCSEEPDSSEPPSKEDSKPSPSEEPKSSSTRGVSEPGYGTSSESTPDGYPNPPPPSTKSGIESESKEGSSKCNCSQTTESTTTSTTTTPGHTPEDTNEEPDGYTVGEGRIVETVEEVGDSNGDDLSEGGYGYGANNVKRSASRDNDPDETEEFEIEWLDK